ncbi:hypothetical protein [Mesorhizobium sp. ISC15]
MKLVNHTALLLALEMGAVRLGRTRIVTDDGATLIISLHDDDSAVGE